MRRDPVTALVALGGNLGHARHVDQGLERRFLKQIFGRFTDVDRLVADAFQIGIDLHHRKAGDGKYRQRHHDRTPPRRTERHAAVDRRHRKQRSEAADAAARRGDVVVEGAGGVEDACAVAHHVHAQQIVAEAVRLLGTEQPASEAHTALKTALVTQPDAMTPEVRERLAVFLN